VVHAAGKLQEKLFLCARPLFFSKPKTLNTANITDYSFVSFLMFNHPSLIIPPIAVRGNGLFNWFESIIYITIKFG